MMTDRILRLHEEFFFKILLRDRDFFIKWCEEQIELYAHIEDEEDEEEDEYYKYINSKYGSCLKTSSEYYEEDTKGLYPSAEKIKKYFEKSFEALKELYSCALDHKKFHFLSCYVENCFFFEDEPYWLEESALMLKEFTTYFSLPFVSWDYIVYLDGIIKEDEKTQEELDYTQSFFNDERVKKITDEKDKKSKEQEYQEWLTQTLEGKLQLLSHQKLSPKALMNSQKEQFYKALLNNATFTERFSIFPQISFESFLSSENETLKLCYAHLVADFLIVDKKTLEPLAVLNFSKDPQKRDEKSIDDDLLRKKVCENANIKLVSFEAGLMDIDKEVGALLEGLMSSAYKYE